MREQQRVIARPWHTRRVETVRKADIAHALDKLKRAESIARKKRDRRDHE